MNPETNIPAEPDQIRSDIDNTRRQMDGTIDALSERMQGRHLIDEILGFFRRESGEGKVGELKTRLGESTSTAARRVVDTVKEHPLPVLAIGAGLAWLIYDTRRSNAGQRASDESYAREDEAFREEPGQAWGEASTFRGAENSKLQEVKETLREKTSAAKQVIQQKASQLGEQASALGSQAKEKTRQIYSQGRERIVQTADQHPLELGLVCLAAGVIAGLAVPTPEKMNAVVGPRADRLRRRVRDAGQDIVNRGKSVAQAAASAAREEARTQGLTPQSIAERAQAGHRQAQSPDQPGARPDRPFSPSENPQQQESPAAAGTPEASRKLF